MQGLEGVPCHCACCAVHALAVGVYALQDVIDVLRQIRRQALLAVPGHIHRILSGVQIHKGLHSHTSSIPDKASGSRVGKVQQCF